MERNEPTYKEMSEVNNKWHSGLENLKILEAVRKSFINKRVEEQEMESIRKLNSKLMEYKRDFEENLKTIRENNYTESNIF